MSGMGLYIVKQVKHGRYGTTVLGEYVIFADNENEARELFISGWRPTPGAVLEINYHHSWGYKIK